MRQQAVAHCTCLCLVLLGKTRISSKTFQVLDPISLASGIASGSSSQSSCCPNRSETPIFNDATLQLVLKEWQGSTLSRTQASLRATVSAHPFLTLC